VPFIVGVNLPWIQYGGDFGANAWRPDGGVATAATRERAERALKDIAAAGASVVRWFLLCDGRAGLVIDDRGRPIDLDTRVLRDLEVAVGLAQAAGVQLMPVLFDFHWCHRGRRVNGVDLGGRRRVLADPDARARLLDRIVSPIVSTFGSHDAVYAWDIINEPEWATLGLGTLNPGRAIGREAMRSFIADTAALIHARASQPVTVGSASARWLPLVTATGLDFYQVHWYDKLDRHAPIDRPVSALAVDRPVMLGEFPTRGSQRSAGDLFTTARDRGYAGALPWSWMADDGATDPAEAARAISAARQVDSLR
jgi:hypothetical protein